MQNFIQSIIRAFFAQLSALISQIFSSVNNSGKNIYK